MTQTARDAAQDVAVAVDAVADAMTWRVIAQQAIHRLAAAHAEHEALRVRYARLLDEFRALRVETRRREAAQEARYARLLSEHRALLNTRKTMKPATAGTVQASRYYHGTGHAESTTHAPTL